MKFAVDKFDINFFFPWSILAFDLLPRETMNKNQQISVWEVTSSWPNMFVVRTRSSLSTVHVVSQIHGGKDLEELYEDD